jgi:hypothetical protein
MAIPEFGTSISLIKISERGRRCDVAESRARARGGYLPVPRWRMDVTRLHTTIPHLVLLDQCVGTHVGNHDVAASRGLGAALATPQPL